MKYLVAKDYKRRQAFKPVEYKSKIISAIFRDERFNASSKFSIQAEFTRYGLLGSTRIRNRCTVTGRGRGIFRKFRVSRISFRQLALFGQLPGIRKSSW